MSHAPRRRILQGALFCLAAATLAACGSIQDATSSKGSAMTSPISTHSLQVGADTYAYLKAGQGPALMIVHGVGGHKEDWQGVMAAMAPTHTVYAVDMLGFGGSSRGAPDLGMTAQANALLALMDQQKILQADILGNSVGGWVSATFAASHPDRVKRLILVDPAGFRAMFEGQPPVNLFPNSVEEMRKLLSFVLVKPETQTDAFAASAFAQFQASGEKTIEARFGPQLFQSARLEDVMPKIKAQTLVIWGRDDRLFPVALAPYITSLTPGATSTVIDNASHFPQVDNPTAFTAAMKTFLLTPSGGAR